jgi:hypothetical protein
LPPHSARIQKKKANSTFSTHRVIAAQYRFVPERFNGNKENCLTFGLETKRFADISNNFMAFFF